MQLVVVIDEGFRVKYYSTGKKNASDLESVLEKGRLRLRPDIEAIAAGLVAEAGADPSDESPVALLDSDRMVRLSRLGGSESTLYALIFGTNHNRQSLMRAAVRYTLTRRQCEVLALILEGDSVGEIAEALCIAENTVQGYVKSLLSKTKSRNRPAMVAKVLDWQQVRSTAPERGVLTPAVRFSGGRIA
jgi:DNA-binding CsgD family transcriptional regulator